MAEPNYGRNADLAAERDAILALPPDQMQRALLAFSQRRSGVPEIPGGYRNAEFAADLPAPTGRFATNIIPGAGPDAAKSLMGKDETPPASPLAPARRALSEITGMSPSMRGLVGAQMSALESDIPLAERQARIQQGQAGARAEGAAGAQRGLATAERSIAEQYAPRPVPAFVPTQETAADMGTLFSLLAVAGQALGGKGKAGAMTAMASMTGMLNGWRQGRQDLYERERRNFDAGIRQIQAQNATLQEIHNRALRAAQTDMQGALAEAEQRAIAAGAELPALAGQRAGIQGLSATLQNLTQLQGRIDERVQSQVAAEQLGLRAREDQDRRDQALRAARVADQQAQEQRALEARRATDLATAQRRNIENAGMRAQEIIDNQSPEQQERTRTVLGRAANTATTAKNINDAYTIFESSEAAARQVAQYRDAVGPLGVALNAVRADPASGPIRSITNWFTGQPGDDVRGEAAMNQAIDRAVQQGAMGPDMAARAKVVSKTLFSLALADAQATGRPTVFLERALSAFYSQALRTETLLEIIHGRAEEATRRLPDPSLRPNTRRDYNDNFSILSAMRENRFDPQAFLNRYPVAGSGTTTQTGDANAPGRMQQRQRDAAQGRAVDPADGATATNPQTGERMVRRNGRWEPAQ